MTQLYKRGWNRLYQSAPLVYDRFARAQDSWPFLEQIRGVTGITNKRFMDVGTGTGKYAFLLSEQGAERVIGIDKCQEMINVAINTANEGHFTNVEFLRTDAKELTFSTLFDVAVSAWAINTPWNGSYNDLDSGLSAIFRSLKAGGVVFIVTTPPGEMGGELNLHFDRKYVKLHTEKKGRFIAHLRERWGFNETRIRADWKFSSIEEAALCFGLVYGPKLADVLLQQGKQTIEAAASLLIASNRA